LGQRFSRVPMMVILQIKELGLAAYMQMKGCTLIGYDKDKRHFKFESEAKSVEDWSIEYANSCCSKHDRNILTLRNIVRNSKG